MTRDSRAVCILGMHRSGTSMVARILQACGLALGPEARLMPGRSDNPDGFFENLDVAGINDDLLEAFEGGWDAPPRFEPGWESSRRAREFEPRAREILESIAGDCAGHGAWGWKDPRGSLTLPFWRRLLPDVRTVVCLRHPVEVARSLCSRDHHSFHFGLRLWNAYYASLSDELRSPRCVLTRYDDWFLDPVTELDRILRFLELDVDRSRMESAARIVNASTRHHEVGRTEAGGSSAEDTARFFQSMLRIGKRAYEPGETLQFGWRGNGLQFRETGWGAAEPGGTWTEASTATLRIVSSRDLSLPARLVIRLLPMVVPGRHQIRLAVRSNGRMVKEWYLSEPGAIELEAPLDETHIPKGEDWILSFEVFDPMSPLSLGMSDDRRELGIFLIELGVLSATEFHSGQVQ